MTGAWPSSWVWTFFWCSTSSSRRFTQKMGSMTFFQDVEPLRVVEKVT